ncbi:MAG: MarR family transcriptional regulator [Chitinophaga sp.]|uniref:MarR family winged helix-turn-helix transcriptional regulator n=1 Tax=Chitinophaga sp. TaxID=1869181 RepID=UPI001B0EC26A|nr:MarR family winged helix-turn-helix transcriptional regulator [Chitinophaga sp.]MBO9730874.1 MarR family transcriptional regulator [Chitinophaga sp.]
MKPLVALITAWDHYTTQTTTPTVADFCQQYLQKNPPEAPAAAIPAHHANGVLAGLVGQASQLHTTYARMAIKEIPGIELEWFYLLNVIHMKKAPKKSDAISLSHMEQSTGIDILNRMKKKGLIVEKEDPTDKRARLVSLTEKGKALMVQIGFYLYKVSYLLYHDIKEEEKKQLIQILAATAAKHEQIRLAKKHQHIDDMIQSLYGDHALKSVLNAFKKEVRQQEKVLRNTPDKDIDALITSFHKD